MWRYWVLLHVRADGNSPVSMTKVGIRERTAHRGALCVGRAWPIDRCSNKDAGSSESKTPIFCETGQRQKKTKNNAETIYCGAEHLRDNPAPPSSCHQTSQEPHHGHKSVLSIFKSTVASYLGQSTKLKVLTERKWCFSQQRKRQWKMVARKKDNSTRRKENMLYFRKIFRTSHVPIN